MKTRTWNNEAMPKILAIFSRHVLTEIPALEILCWIIMLKKISRAYSYTFFFWDFEISNRKYQFLVQNVHHVWVSESRLQMIDRTVIRYFLLDFFIRTILQEYRGSKCSKLTNKLDQAKITNILRTTARYRGLNVSYMKTRVYASSRFVYDPDDSDFLLAAYFTALSWCYVR